MTKGKSQLAHTTVVNAKQPPVTHDLHPAPPPTTLPNSLDQFAGYSSSRSEAIASRLDASGQFWRDNASWLAERSYILRPRYQPNWTPSWKQPQFKGHWTKAEDSMVSGAIVLDAMCKSNKPEDTPERFVVMKRTSTTHSPQEVEIAWYLTSGNLAEDPKNHCVPMVDVLQVPKSDTEIIIVMPLLKAFNKPCFQTIGEIVAFLTQCFDGLEFMHKHRVAHLDCNGNNIMMDASPLYPVPYHPVDPSRRRDWKGSVKRFFRTQWPVKYYFIDFGLSRRFDPGDSRPLWEPIRGGDKSVPEHQGARYFEASNPFLTDVYYLGNMIRKNLMEECRGLGFLESLAADMTQEDPSKRPPINAAAHRFREIRSSLSSWKLRSRVVYRCETISKLWRPSRHWFMTVTYILTRKNAIPDP